MTPTDPTSTPPSTPPGIQFEELRPPPIPDHELIRCIGRGSYGEVWLARNIMGTYRAVKIVHRSTFGDDRPFEREYNGIQRFEPVSRSHESQVDILHIGRHNGCFYYVMELADDQDRGQEIDPDRYKPRNLRTVVERQGRLTADETLEIALALVTALEHLHSHGLVHRDIKPSNIIFVPLKTWLEPPLARRTPPSLPYYAAMVWAEVGELDRARAMLALAVQRERWWRDNPTDPIGWFMSAVWGLQRTEVEARLGE